MNTVVIQQEHCAKTNPKLWERFCALYHKTFFKLPVGFWPESEVYNMYIDLSD